MTETRTFSVSNPEEREMLRKMLTKDTPLPQKGECHPCNCNLVADEPTIEGYVTVTVHYKPYQLT